MSAVSGQWPQCPSSSDLSHTQSQNTDNTNTTMGDPNHLHSALASVTLSMHPVAVSTLTLSLLSLHFPSLSNALYCLSPLITCSSTWSHAAHHYKIHKTMKKEEVQIEATIVTGRQLISNTTSYPTRVLHYSTKTTN